MKKNLILILFSALFSITTSCNTILPNVSNVSLGLSVSEISALDKEYSFSTKALTASYMKKKFDYFT